MKNKGVGYAYRNMRVFLPQNCAHDVSRKAMPVLELDSEMSIA